MKNIVCKFGGSSLADSESIKLVSYIVLSKNRNYVVVSAPGKRFSNDVKITDALIDCYKCAVAGGSYEKSFNFVKNRFVEIVSNLGLDFDLSSIFEEIDLICSTKPQYDYIVSRGEYINALILSKYLKYDFIDSKDFIIFNNNKVDIEKSKEKLQHLICDGHKYVFPGFYGSDETGSIKTFSRGGSDITGAIIAQLLNCDLYENYTDVDGIMTMDPRLNKKGKIIPHLTYDEVRCLSFSGANVLHADCTRFLKENNIPLHLLNTFNLHASGSIVSTKKNGLSPIGMSMIDGLKLLTIESFGINSNVQQLNNILSLLNSENIEIYHMMLGLDHLLILTNTDLERLKQFEDSCVSCKYIDKTSHCEDIAMVSVVGDGIIHCDDVEKKIYRILSNTSTPIIHIYRDRLSPEIMFLLASNFSHDFMNYLHDELFI